MKKVCKCLVEKTYLIISDLDGTLLNSQGNLTEETINKVQDIVKQGHIFCIATGRPKRGAMHIYKQLKLKTIMLNQNGAYISNPSDKSFSPIDFCFSKSIAIKILKNEKLIKLIDNVYFETKGNEIQLYPVKGIPKHRDDFIKFYHIDVIDPQLENLHGNVDNLKVDVSAILLYVDSNDTATFDKIVYHVKAACPSLQLRMIKLPHNGFVVEINTMFTDKAMGLNYLESYYGIPKDRILAFGDGDNDMRMLSKAKYGFAMKNGKDTAKLSARHITKHTNDENGVAWELEWFFNNKEALN